MRAALVEALWAHASADAEEATDLAQIVEFVKANESPFDRRIAAGHLTASALVLSASGRRVLLLHHRKLARWLQPGGHAEPGETDGLAVARREVREETGLSELGLHARASGLFDVDVHEIPARKDEPAHLHLDLRYLLLAPDGAVLARQLEETNALRWFEWAELAALDLDHGLRRALAKARALFG